MLLAGSSGLAACSSSPYPGGPGLYPGGTGPMLLGPGGGGPGGSVAILAPLSGARAGIGRQLVQAAQLALSAPGSPTLAEQDTAGTPQGAAAAAHTAIGSGARLILGPLTAPEVAAVAPVARSAGIPILAFSNDSAVGASGVWPLGISPAQQVRRVISAASEAGHAQTAALLPEDAFGHAMADALNQVASQRGLPPPSIRFHGSGMNAINQAVRSLSDYQSRWGPIQEQIRAARAEGSSEGRRRADQLSKSALPPPPFDTLLLADTGESLAEIAAVLPYYFVGPPAVQLLGPALWAEPRSGSKDIRGAWFAAPDPAAREPFVQAFTARYGAAPPTVADVAYDAASVARVAAAQGPATLTNPAGFNGADGWVALLADGEVRRGLALFQVESGGPRLIQPGPTSAA